MSRSQHKNTNIVDSQDNTAIIIFWESKLSWYTRQRPQKRIVNTLSAKRIWINVWMKTTKSQLNKIIKRIQDTKIEFNKDIESQEKGQTEMKLDMKSSGCQTKSLEESLSSRLHEVQDKHILKTRRKKHITQSKKTLNLNLLCGQYDYMMSWKNQNALEENDQNSRLSKPVNSLEDFPT